MYEKWPSRLGIQIVKRNFYLPIATVTAFVILHVSLRREGLGAAGLRAGKLVFLVVNTQVDGHVGLFCEGFAAARPGAFKGLCALVEHNVGPQADGAVETCLAAFERAHMLLLGPSFLDSVAS